VARGRRPVRRLGRRPALVLAAPPRLTAAAAIGGPVSRSERVASGASRIRIGRRRPPAVVLASSLVHSLFGLEPLQEIYDRRPDLWQRALEVLRCRLLVNASFKAVSQDSRNREEVPWQSDQGG
jgi:hypothetical protein